MELEIGVTGSVLRGDVAAAGHVPAPWQAGRVRADRDAILAVITLAKKGCFADAMFRHPVTIGSTIFLNGNPVRIDGITD